MSSGTDRVKAENGLKQTLEAFETALVTPIVSGELAAWVTGLRKTWAQASSQLQDSLRRGHVAQYEQMAEADPEMLPRIDQLKAEDEALAIQSSEIDQMVSRAAQHVPKLEPDEVKAQKHVQGLIDAGMAFLIRVRKQEVAVETWFVEAFNRDRGAGD